MITAWIAAPLMIFAALLGLRISRLRLTGRARSTEKDTLVMFERWQRAHGNLVEHAPMVLILMYLLERAYGSGPLVKVIGVVFVVSRLLHAYGTITPSRWPKFTGASLTYLVELTLGVGLLTRMILTR
jgi:uncharacterized membrane protein YecN with MAPEG domain